LILTLALTLTLSLPLKLALQIGLTLDLALKLALVLRIVVLGVVRVVRIVITHDRLLLEEHRRDEGAPIFCVGGLAVSDAGDTPVLPAARSIMRWISQRKASLNGVNAASCP
jgi:hypothetical protein